MNPDRAVSSGSANAIAVVGISCRLPHAPNPEAFWKLLCEGRHAVEEVPAGRWEGLPSAQHPATRYGAFVDAIDMFDADFFGISPREAVGIDPQQRLMLELAWEALEDTGIAPETLRDSDTGVFVGAIWDDYARLLHEYGPAAITPHTVTGVQRGMIANRVSYTLGLNGPSLTVDTAQSSSLVAVHTACESLRTGESTLALVGGVNLNILPESTVTMERFGGLSPNGRCFTFDARANGFVRGEGGAAVVLKPLRRAVADGDRVYSVIIGSAVNNDGATPAFTVPSADRQEEVIRAAGRRAGTTPLAVQYVELHGTGTEVGDPIEAAALGAALGSGRPAGSPLVVGSVKTNIGHLEGAAGITGLVKTVLAIHGRMLPPSLNFRSPNPAIPLSELNLEVNTVTRAWPAPDRPLVAGVSSFGMGGTNCHVVLSEPPSSQPASSQPRAVDAAAPAMLCPVSGGTEQALRAQAERLDAFLAQDSDSTLSDVGYSLATTRSAFSHRAVVVADTREDLRQGLRALSQWVPAANLVQGVVPETSCPVVFIFAGQGSQRPEMGLGLYHRFRVFAEAIDECDAALRPFTGRPLMDVLRQSPDNTSWLNQADVVQPALWAVTVALARLWQSLGIQPDAVVGHSQGEIAAAHIAGALSIDEAARVVALRGRALTALSGSGTMAWVPLPVEDLHRRLRRWEGRLSIAATNGPASTTVSGDTDSIAELVADFGNGGIDTRPVLIDYASHTPHIEAIHDRIIHDLADLHPRSSTIAFHSTVDGRDHGSPLDTTAMTADYWYENLRRPVRFHDTVRRLLDRGDHTFVELSAHPQLIHDVVDILGTVPERSDSVTIGSLRKDRPETSTFATALAQLHCHGHLLRWREIHPTGKRVGLPTYPFQRQRHWPVAHDGSVREHIMRNTASDSDETTTTESTVAEKTGRTGSFAAELAGMPDAERDSRLVELVRICSGVVLGHVTSDTVRTDRTFRELGFDSTTAIELGRRLSSAMELPLPATLIYDHPTPRKLARFLGTQVLGGVTRPAADLGAATVADEPIAIVGMGCRCPGAVVSPDDLWRLVSEGTDAIDGLPTNRGWDIDSLYDPDLGHPGTSYVREGGFIYAADEFDADFFGISPREAAAMDPQQRVILETTWETVESAGIDPSSLRGSRTAVFIGTIPQAYRQRDNAAEEYEGYLLTGRTTSVLSGRVAFLLGLEGPAVTVDTACSSSLVALHLAVRALRHGECDMALAGGVTVLSTPEMFTEFSRQRILSPDGRCKPFAAAADGIGLADGVGMLALQRLSDARRDGRRILAVVRGSAVNQDGASNGLTAPSGPAQEKVIRQALADAGLSAADIDVVEAHGTGTRLGDPIEAQAILATYGQNRPADHPVWLGSVKSNIGHTQAAAGVLGVVKMVQAIRHRLVPQTLHVDTPSPHVDWTSGAVVLPTDNTPWPDRQRPCRAGISSFGISGTNAHLIIEQAPADSGPQQQRFPENTDVPATVTWTISAQSAPALRAQAQRLSTHLAERPDLGIVDIGYSLDVTRAALTHRAVVLGRSREEFERNLQALARDTAGTRDIIVGMAGESADRERRVFVFPGQGGQRPGMGMELYRRFPAYASAFDEVCAALQALTGWSVHDVLEQRPDAPTLDRVDIVQPALFAVMTSLAALWRSMGVQPAAVVGHSQGEIAAAHVAGALTLTDAARIVVSRSRALTTLIGAGGMASVLLPAEDVARRMRSWPDKIAVAAINGLANTSVSGDNTALDEFLAHCDRDGIDARRIPVDYPSHTTHVERIRDLLLRELTDLDPRPAAIPFYSTVDGESHGDPMDTTAMTADYWYRNLRRSVQFAPVIPSVLAHGMRTFVEVSPHPILVAGVQNIAENTAVDAVAVGSLRRGQDEAHRFLSSAAELWVGGSPVDWQHQFGAPPSPQRVDLPTYAFQRRRHWLVESAPAAADLPALGLASGGHPMLGASIELADGGGLFTGRISIDDHPWLADHRICGEVLVPGIVWLELVLHAATRMGCAVVEELIFETRLQLPEHHGFRLELAVGAADDNGRRAVNIHSLPDGDSASSVTAWTCHARGTLVPAGTGSAGFDADLATWPVTGGQPLSVDDVYRELGLRGYEYGPAFTGLRDLRRRGADIYAEVALDDSSENRVAGYGVFPALLDAALHATLFDRRVDPDRILLPFSCAGVRLAARGATRLRVRIGFGDDGSMSLVAADSAGQPVIVIESLRVQAAPRRSSPAEFAPDPLYVPDWVAVSVGPQPGARPDSWWGVVDHRSAAGMDADTDTSEVGIGAGDVEITVEDTLPALVAEAERRARPPDVVVVLCRARRSGPPVSPVESVRTGVGRMLATVQQWLGDEHLDSTRLVVVTRGGVTVADEPPPEPAQAGVWGLIRSAQSEHPGRIILVDVDPTGKMTRTVTEIVAAAVNAGEPQVAVRGMDILAPRLVRDDLPDRLSIPEDRSPWRLDRLGPGSLSDLALVAHPELLAPLASGQVRISVRSAGLNFKDVLATLGVVDAEALGIEGAGVVAGVADDVADLTPGDRVFGLMAGAFGSSAIADRRLLVQIPTDWSFEQAASVPVAFATAYYCLADIAAVHAGESVLIHAGTGAVGMAAIQLARYWGAEVYATASRGKHDALRSLGLDDEHIADSRDPDFASRFRAGPARRGVDVVVNSLRGRFVDAGLELLSAGGRFVEIGKTDIRDADTVAAARPDVSYHVFDLLQCDPRRTGQILAEVTALYRRNVLAFPPLQTRDVRRAPEALRVMSQARHIGKLVLTIPSSPNPNGTVLITGGTGTLGGLIAARLVSHHGVRNLVLVSRRGPAAEGVDRLQDRLRALGARVDVIACDIADRAQVADVLTRVPAERPLIGVVHTAVTLDDGLIGDLSAERVETVFRAKVYGALHLHELTRDMNLSMFVLFSSVSGLIGMPGQGNYAAANTALDALAQVRRAQGLAGVSTAWGLWARESGATAGLDDASRARFGRAGLLPLPTDRALQLFDQAMRTVAPVVAAVVVAPGPVAGEPPAMLRGIVRASLGVADNTAGPVSGLRQRLAHVAEGESERLVLDVVCRHAEVVLGHGAADTVDPTRAFKDQGFDSLTAVELRNRLAAETGLRLPPTVVFDHPTPTALTRHLRARLTGDIDTTPVPTATSAGAVTDDAVAIVGIGCRFPGGVTSAESLWELVIEGRDAVGGFPADRGWDLERLFDSDPDQPGTSYTRAGGFLHDAAGFDGDFFGISPREALAMDPQQRLLLELAWEAIEHAGIDPTTLRGSNTGVFAGVYSTGHDVQAHGSDSLAGHLVTGSATSVASGRIAYTLGLEGPALTVDTACSSSLVATHLACQALRRSECDLALAGGATVLSTPQLFIGFSRQRGLARDGRCKAFSAAADGMGIGEGAGLIVLERLGDARRHRHRVLAVIAGSAVNQDGASNGLSAPNGPSQQRVIRQALADAHLSATDIDAVEAHGTGTVLGDPIEAEALLATYGRGRPADRPLWLGSIKSNIAHTQASAGIAGVIKMTQSIHHGILPETLHADEPSSHIDWTTGTVRLLTRAREWPNGDRPRRAGISSFGISGTNTHLILVQAPLTPTLTEAADTTIRTDPPTLIWPISAASRSALAAQAARLREHLVANPDLDLTDLAYSLATTRARHSYRAAITHAPALGEARKGLFETLHALEDGRDDRHLTTGRVPRRGPGKMVFVLPGEGSQHPGMGKHLYDRFPPFARALDEICAALDAHLNISLREVMLDDRNSPHAELLEQTAYAQPALFAFGAALHRLFAWAGVVPDYLLGHSIGEVTAAYLAGVLSLRDAATLVTARGRLMQSCPTDGVMVAVQADEDEVLPLLDNHEDSIAIAAVNSHNSIVLSGDRARVEKVCDHFAARGRTTTRLQVSHAFNSPLMDAILQQFHDVAVRLTYSPPTAPILSNLTGQVADLDQLASAEYWTRQLRRTVRFAESVRTLLDAGTRMFLELSPHPTLTSAIGDIIEHTADTPGGPVAMGTLCRNQPDEEAFGDALARLHCRGHSVNVHVLYPTAQTIALPTYAFQHRDYWLRPAPVRDVTAAGLDRSDHPLLGAVIELPDNQGWVFTGMLSSHAYPWLREHTKTTKAIFPAAGFLELALYAGGHADCPRIEELALHAPLPTDDRRQLRITVNSANLDGRRAISIHTRATTDSAGGNGTQPGWILHAAGIMSSASEHTRPEPATTWPPTGCDRIDLAGPTGVVRAAWRRNNTVYADLSLQDTTTDTTRFAIHPALLDAALDTHSLTRRRSGAGERTQLPSGFAGVSLHAGAAGTARAHLTSTGENTVSLALFDTADRLMIVIDTLTPATDDTDNPRG